MLISTSVLTTLGGPCPSVCVPALPVLEASPGPGAGSVKCVSRGLGLEETALTYHVARSILVAGTSHSTGVPVSWFSQCGLEGPPSPRPRGSACPQSTLFCRLCLRWGTGSARSHCPPQHCVLENHTQSHASTPSPNLLTGPTANYNHEPGWLSGVAILTSAVGSPGPASRLSTRPQRRPL